MEIDKRLYSFAAKLRFPDAWKKKLVEMSPTETENFTDFCKERAENCNGTDTGYPGDV